MTEGYSHLTNMVSELGTIGTKTQYIFTFSLVVISVLSILFVVGLCRIAKRSGLSITPILLILTFSFSILGAGIFPLPLKLHGILGSPSMLLPLSPLLSLFLWRESTIRNIKIAAAISATVISLGFLTLTPEVLDSYFGLKQRFFHVGWSLWFIYLSVKFIELDKASAASKKMADK
jgi:hypothetical membrane protein